MSGVDLTRWSRVRHADGSVVLTAPANHPAFATQRRATLRIRHDVRPLAPLAAVCDALCAPRMQIEHARPIERVVTRGGEYGAIRHLRVTVAGDALEWAVGLVVEEDRMTVVDGLARSPNIVALVRDQLVAAVWGGAYDRIRMVPYQPPAGWFGLRRAMATCWLAPGAPRVPAMIVACDAVPRGPAERTHALLWPLDVPDHAPWAELDGAATPGRLATWVLDERYWAIVQISDARWSARVALQAGDEDHVRVLCELARTIELPPAPASPSAPPPELYGWMAL